MNRCSGNGGNGCLGEDHGQCRTLREYLRRFGGYGDVLGEFNYGNDDHGEEGFENGSYMVNDVYNYNLSSSYYNPEWGEQPYVEWDYAQQYEENQKCQEFQGSTQSYQDASEEENPLLEEMLIHFMEKADSYLVNHQASIENFESQLELIVQHVSQLPMDTLPKDMEINPMNDEKELVLEINSTNEEEHEEEKPSQGKEDKNDQVMESEVDFEDKDGIMEVNEELKNDEVPRKMMEVCESNSFCLTNGAIIEKWSICGSKFGLNNSRCAFLDSCEFVLPLITLSFEFEEQGRLAIEQFEAPRQIRTWMVALSESIGPPYPFCNINFKFHGGIFIFVLKCFILNLRAYFNVELKNRKGCG